MSKFDTIIIGAGPAGLEAARQLTEMGHSVLLMEKDEKTGGKMRQWDKLFPNFSSSSEVLQQLTDRLGQHNLQIKTGTSAEDVRPMSDHRWQVTDQYGKEYIAESILLTTGYDFFDASRKEEYGYGIYPNVITSVELEEMLLRQEIRYPGKTSEDHPKMAFIQCVGSRDEKIGNHYCSRNCCICAVKQSIELRELLPQAEIYCFYMDLRMFGQSYEELYRKAQQDSGVHFIRGRVSEVAPSLNNKVLLKAEDTLLSRPVKGTFDLVVLMVGMDPAKSTKKFTHALGIGDDYGYALSVDGYGNDNSTLLPGLFVAGTCKRPMSIPDVIKDADAASFIINTYLFKNRSSL